MAWLQVHARPITSKKTTAWVLCLVQATTPRLLLGSKYLGLNHWQLTLDTYKGIEGIFASAV